MQLQFRTIVAAAALAVIGLCGTAVAQQEPTQIALTEKQVQSFIAAQPAVSKITSKLKAEPTKKQMTDLDGIAKKNGFADYAELENVASNISMVMQGIDPKTKKFGDPKAMLEAQIAEVQANKKMKAAEKKEALEDLNETLKNLQPIKNQGNIALVEQNYDKIAAATSEPAPSTKKK